MEQQATAVAGVPHEMQKDMKAWLDRQLTKPSMELKQLVCEVEDEGLEAAMFLLRDPDFCNAIKKVYQEAYPCIHPTQANIVESRSVRTEVFLLVHVVPHVESLRPSLEIGLKATGMILECPVIESARWGPCFQQRMPETYRKGTVFPMLIRAKVQS
jgi:hypothetical protein